MQLAVLTLALCWAYPVTIYLSYLLSRLGIALYRKHKDSTTGAWYEKHRKAAFTAIFWLQLVQCFDLVSGSSPDCGARKREAIILLNVLINSDRWAGNFHYHHWICNEYWSSGGGLVG